MGKARSKDTSSLKSAIMDLIPLLQGYELISPSLKKPDRGFKHDSTGSLLCPVGTDWSDIRCVVCSAAVNYSRGQTKSTNLISPEGGFLRKF
jgi:hypothetical protein